ncbi:MAG: DUF3332 domain-containing protein [Vicingaceae bacterium]
MKKPLSIFLSGLLLYVMSFQTGCFGSFGLTSAIWSWNDSIGKFPGELVFLVFIILPIYSIALLIDAVIINTIEFWTGSNPMAMGPNEMEQQVVVGEDGNTYEITARQNRFDIVQLDGKKAGEMKSLVFDTESQSWSYVDGERSIKLAQLSENGATAQVFAPNGQVALVPTNVTDKAQVTSMIEEQLDMNLAILQD